MTYLVTAGYVAGPDDRQIPLDPANLDYQTFLAETGTSHEDALAEAESLRTEAATARAAATTIRRNRERNARQTVRAWLAGTGPAPTLRQLADATASADDDE